MGLREKVAEVLRARRVGMVDECTEIADAVMEVVEGHWTPDAAKVLDLTEQADELKEDVRHWQAEATDAKRIMDRRGEYVKELKSRLRELEEENQGLREKMSAISLVKTWTNEDGNSFMFTDDLLLALGEVTPEALARARDIAKEEK